MSSKPRAAVLRVALERQNYDLAAYTIVYGLVKTKVNDINGKKTRRSKSQPKRS